MTDPEPVDFQLRTDLFEQVIKNPGLDQTIAKPAMGGLIGYWRMQIKPGKQHELNDYRLTPVGLSAWFWIY